MDTTYKVDIIERESGEEVELDNVHHSTTEFLPQDVADTLRTSASAQNINTVNDSSNTSTHNKLLDSVMAVPTLLWTSTIPKAMADSGVRSHIPTGYLQIQDLHAIAQASLIAQTQEIISKQLESEAVQDKTQVKAVDVTMYPCDIKSCTKVMASSSHKKFQDTSNSGVRSLQQCPYKGCNRTFFWPAHLKYHQLTHTCVEECNKKKRYLPCVQPQHFFLQFECIPCTYGGCARTLGEKNYTCDHDGCGKSFYTSQRLLVHNRTHTGVKPFVCIEPSCNKSFTTAQNLANHQRIHTGERPYACEHDGCGRKFAEVSSLRKHGLTHTGKKPFPCDICGKTFTQSGSRTVHWKRHQLNKSTNRNQNLNNCQKARVESGILVLQTDIHGSESVVFSQGISDHVVTVTTQSPEISANHIQLTEVLNTGSLHTGDLAAQHKGVNFVVLSQPQELINLSTFHHKHDSGEPTKEILFKNELLNSNIDHKEITHSEFSQSLTNSQEGKEILVEDQLVTQEVREVIVGDRINSEGDREIIVVGSLMSEGEGEITDGDSLMCRGEREIGSVGDCINSEGERDISVGDSLICREREIGSVRDCISTEEEMTVSVGDDGLITQGEVEVCVGDNILPQSVINGRQNLSEHGNLSSSSQTGKEMVMDPMMESDDEGEIAMPTGTRRKDS